MISQLPVFYRNSFAAADNRLREHMIFLDKLPELMYFNLRIIRKFGGARFA
jgi:hypothetical protein